MPLADELITEIFHVLYFYAGNTWNGGNTTWQGVPVYQNPLDLWVHQEILSETKPDVIVETGTAYGGSALFFVSAFPGEVISIDTQAEWTPEAVHPRITFLKGKSTDPDIVAEVRRRVAGKRVHVFLDSDHSAENVLAEMETYAPLVTLGCYLVVHDTNLGGHPIRVENQNDEDPAKAVRKYCEKHVDLEVDKTREKHLMTFSPGGWLRKVG